MLPFTGWLTILLGYPIVVRQWRRSRFHLVDSCIARLKAGEHISISIEGRRSRDGTLSDYKTGAARIAITSGRAIVPVIITGTRACLPHGSWLPRKGQVVVKVLPVVEVENVTIDERRQLTKKLRLIAESTLKQQSP